MPEVMKTEPSGRRTLWDQTRLRARGGPRGVPPTRGHRERRTVLARRASRIVAIVEEADRLLARPRRSPRGFVAACGSAERQASQRTEIEQRAVAEIRSAAALLSANDGSRNARAERIALQDQSGRPAVPDIEPLRPDVVAVDLQRQRSDWTLCMP